MCGVFVCVYLVLGRHVFNSSPFFIRPLSGPFFCRYFLVGDEPHPIILHPFRALLFVSFVLRSHCHVVSRCYAPLFALV